MSTPGATDLFMRPLIRYYGWYSDKSRGQNPSKREKAPLSIQAIVIAAKRVLRDSEWKFARGKKRPPGRFSYAFSRFLLVLSSQRMLARLLIAVTLAC